MSIPPSAPRRRQSPTAAELRAWRLFIETSEQVKNVVAARLQNDAGLSTGDYGVLLALSEHPEKRMRSSLLAEHIGWERSRLSHHLGRMERRGLIHREPVAGDSRGAEIALTVVGAQLFRAGSAPHLHAIRDVFSRALSPEQLASLEDVMRTLREHVDDLPH
ncbi:MarR family winged helix-turn-helix transcriptional regulator [Microbacterium proteolyticum]|uniref:MarR family winged helix-turn-helix transcriptional regulator n=1 Tax=Microbacterium proteolyticum TaxID=1572644 RepID=UPI001FAB76F4|nr:MarR family winged helix-turn-helix transcriptional regulator [Microbacterium proteolyticum]MCI9857045.1 winged helix-turn-helix transcriptional regulator [Microbacterium proteolyticum]